MTAPITIGSFGGIKDHLVPIWPLMNRASSAAAAATAAAAWAFSDSRGVVRVVVGVCHSLTMSPLLTGVEGQEGGGGGLNRASTIVPLVYSPPAANVTAGRAAAASC